MALVAVEILRCCPSCEKMVSAHVREFVGKPASPSTPTALPQALFGEKTCPHCGGQIPFGGRSDVHCRLLNKGANAICSLEEAERIANTLVRDETMPEHL